MPEDLRLPSMFLLPTGLRAEEQIDLRDTVASFIDDIEQAEVIVGNITKKRRAEFELRRHGLRFCPVTETEPTASSPAIGDSTLCKVKASSAGSKRHDLQVPNKRKIKVVKLDWVTHCLARGEMLSVEPYLILEAFKTAGDDDLRSEASHACGHEKIQESFDGPREGVPASQEHSDFQPTSIGRQPPPPLVRRTTSEHDNIVNLPDIPGFLECPYSCQRPTLASPPNAEFISELKKIRALRLLQGDKIGVRAYSTSIAVLSAYPYKIQNSYEIERLPGCSIKVVDLFRQWTVDGTLMEISAAAADSRLPTLQLFYDIWGVGDTTAREFYKKGAIFVKRARCCFSDANNLAALQGWRDLDDVIEYGWHSLSRVQQIGLKYYAEFKKKVSRPEAESVGQIILQHALGFDNGYEVEIAGSYRRGKQESGDVDVIISHRDEMQTSFLIEKLIVSLENADLITHTLSLWTTNSERGQRPLAWHGGGSHGSGFDTLDKAMLVWQDKKTYGEDAPHRRVDIIVSPWKTVGCALLGWSGGMTFQRDLRRYCKKERGLKFDSSGIRRRTDGEWIDFEGIEAVPDRPSDSIAPNMEEAEKRVFRGLGLPWRHPTERCTG